MRKKVALFALVAMVVVLATSVSTTEAGCVTCGSRGGALGCVATANGGEFCTIVNGLCLVEDACPGAGGVDPQPQDLAPKVDPRLQANWLVNPRGIEQTDEDVKPEART